jgi:hypothetical protein
MGYPQLLGLTALLAVSLSPASAQVRSLTVGLQSTCRYGLLG